MLLVVCAKYCFIQRDIFSGGHNPVRLDVVFVSDLLNLFGFNAETQYVKDRRGGTQLEPTLSSCLFGFKRLNPTVSH